MKKMMMIAAMMVATLSANAQNEVGQFSLKPTVGLNIATLTKGDNTKSRPGLLIGLEGEYGVAKNFGITAGFFYSQQGTKTNYDNYAELWFDDDYELVGAEEFKGKGTVEYWVCPVQPGKVLFELGGVSEEKARRAFTLAAAKLSVQTTFVVKAVL